MRHGRDPKVVERLDKRLCRYRPPAPHREHVRIAVVERTRRLEDLQRQAAVGDSRTAERLDEVCDLALDAPDDDDGPAVTVALDAAPIRSTRSSPAR